MEAELAKSLNDIAAALQTIQPKKSNALLDVGIKVATGVSTLGIIALFGLFTVQIPALNKGIDHLGWQQARMKDQLDEFKAFTQKPRFTKDDFLLEMRLYDNRLRLIEGELRYRSEFMQETTEKLKDK